MYNPTKLFIATAAIGTSLFAKAEEKQPNVLFIMTDQQNFDMMSCMGNQYLSTPGMDFIAENGYSFTHAYCSNPVSMPSRFSLVTGMPASTVGTKTNVKSTDKTLKQGALQKLASNSMAHAFTNAGYEAVYSGKTHLYGGSKRYGFDVKTQDPYQKGCDEAVKYLQSRKEDVEGEKPFLLFVSLMNPHDICYSAGLDPRYPDNLKATAIEATAKYLELQKSLTPEEYRKQLPPQRPNQDFIITDPNDPDMPDPTNLKGSGKVFQDWTEEERDLFRWMYYRLTESVDELIVQVIDALKESGEFENTIVVFTSDHGELLGAHGYSTKSLLVDADQKIPFIFMGPGIQSGVKDGETFVCNGFDLLPTLYDLTGIPIPEYLPGVSLKPYITGEGEKPQRKYIVTESSNAYQISDGVNKLTVYEKEGFPRMFTNIVDDPLELKNQLKEPRYAKTIKTMQAALEQHLKENGLTLQVK